MPRLLAPLLIAIAAGAMIMGADHARTGRVTDATFLAAGALLLIEIVRQVITLRQNRRLAAERRSFNENLEGVVIRRTRQLSALQELTRVVNSTRRAEEVVAAAAFQTRQALQADAVLIWLVETNEQGLPQPPQLVVNDGLQDWPWMLDYVAQLPMCEGVEILLLPTRPGEEPAAAGALLRAILRCQQRTLGIIGVMRRSGSFDRTETDLLDSIGIEAGAALEHARLYRAALEAADRDPVTDLFNHRALHQRLRLGLEQATVRRYPLSVIMMDLSNFKLFNDTYGHLLGDQVLKHVAGALGEELGERDVLGRYGGDEFLAILPGTDEEQATRAAVRLRDRMAHEGIRRPGDDRILPITLTYGIATFPQDGRNRHDLLNVADANLYAAKRSGEAIRQTSAAQRTNYALRTESSFSVLDAMVTAIDNKDSYTRRHSEDVTEYALWVAEEMGLSEETMRTIRMAGLLHDVGKIGVPDEMLRKPGRLTAEEWEVLKRHPQLGALIVGGVPGMEAMVDAVRYHHERWDGQGYPEGLEGEAIPLLGRIVAIGDAVSAMTTERPYRKGLDWGTTLEEIRRNIGTQFDPTLAEAFLRAAETRLPEKMAITVPVATASVAGAGTISDAEIDRVIVNNRALEAWAVDKIHDRFVEASLGFQENCRRGKEALAIAAAGGVAPDATLDRFVQAAAEFEDGRRRRGAVRGKERDKKP